VTHTIHTPLSDSHSQLAAINQASIEGIKTTAELRDIKKIKSPGSGKAKRVFKSHAAAERREGATKNGRAPSPGLQRNALGSQLLEERADEDSNQRRQGAQDAEH